MPEMTWAEIRKMSPGSPVDMTYRLHSEVMEAPTHTRMCVRNPAALPWRPRSKPMMPPTITERNSRSRTLTILNSFR